MIQSDHKSIEELISYLSLSSDTLRLESNILSGTIPASVCAVFNNSYPVFVSDCLSDLECTCCSHCCTELGECECQFRDSNELQFRCTGFP